RQLRQTDNRVISALRLARPLVQSQLLKAEIAAANTRTLKAQKDLTSDADLGKRLAGLNDSGFHKVIQEVASSLNKAAKTDERFTDLAFLVTLSRFADSKESSAVLAHLQKAKDRAVATADVLWAVMNTKEFLMLAP